MNKKILKELVKARKKQIVEMELIKEFQEQRLEEDLDEKEEVQIKNSISQIEETLPQLKEIYSFLKDYDTE